MKRHFIYLAAAVALMCAIPSNAKKTNVLDISESITDDAIVFPESFETDTQALLEGWYMKNYTATDDRYRTAADPNVSDEVIIQRLKNIPSVIEMPFNHVVRKYIDRYTKHGRNLVTVCLGLGNYYLPIIEQALEAEGLPNELKYIPMIESAFNPNAVSRAGATGLWQFMLSAARGYDMEVNSLVDERRDPYESSKKGARLLKDLYNSYGKWDLAIAAYNCGPGNVNKALRRAGGDKSQHDFWSIYNYLPKETRGYVPMFIAANYIMNYYQDHNISPVVPTKPLVTDTVGVSSRVNLHQIAEVLEIPLDELRLLNPQFRSDIIPGSAQKQYMLVLPSRQIHAYIMSEDEIKNYESGVYGRRVVAEPGALPKESEVAVAEDFETTENDELLAMEPEDGSDEEDYRKVRESSAQKEKTAGGREGKESEAAGSRLTTNAAGQAIHKVAAGETLESIAKTYHVSTDQLTIWNNLSRNSVRTGQELVIKSGNVSSGNNTDMAYTQSRSRSRHSDSDTGNSSAQTKTQKAKPAGDAKPANTKKSGKTQAAQAANAKAAKENNSSTRKKQGGSGSQEQASTKTNKKTKKGKGNTDESVSKNKKGKKNSQKTGEGSSKKKKKDKKTNRKKHNQSKQVTVEVKKGDNLEKIAKRNGVTVAELKKANRLKSDVLHSGDKLKIPKNKKGDAKGKKKNTKGSKKKKSSKSKKK